LFTARGPLIVHLEIYIAGQRQRPLADQVLDAAAKAAGGGAENDPTWAQLMASPGFAAGKFGNAPLDNPAQRQKMIEQFDSNRDGRVQRKELALFLAPDTMDGRPFAIESASDYAMAETNQRSPLFALLDLNEDGRISADEMSAATSRLRSRDADDDDVLTMVDFRQPVSADPAKRRGRTAPRPHAFELNKLEVDSIYYALCERYGADGGLHAAIFPLAPGLFAQLDTDRDGEVDQEEIAGLLNARPDLVLRIDFGPQAENRPRPACKLQTMSDDFAAAGARGRQEFGCLRIEWPDSELDVSVVDLIDDGRAPSAAVRAPPNVPEPEKAAAETQDESTEPDAHRVNDDTRTPPSEQPQSDKHRSYKEALVHVRVGAVEDPLFSWLDVNLDGRLTLREMQGAPERLASLGRDAKGISASEIPDRTACEIVRGTPEKAATLAMPGPRRPRDPQAPRWFLAMDQNRDGEISPREFLGTPEQFKQLDVNGDGILDATEAQAQADSPPG
jgi:hypothetical protein